MDLLPKLIDELQEVLATNKKVAQLERAVAEQQLQIADLNTEIVQLKSKIEVFEHDISSKNSSTSPAPQPTSSEESREREVPKHQPSNSNDNSEIRTSDSSEGCEQTDSGVDGTSQKPADTNQRTKKQFRTKQTEEGTIPLSKSEFQSLIDSFAAGGESKGEGSADSRAREREERLEKLFREGDEIRQEIRSGISRVVGAAYSLGEVTGRQESEREECESTIQTIDVNFTTSTGSTGDDTRLPGGKHRQGILPGSDSGVSTGLSVKPSRKARKRNKKKKGFGKR